MKQLSGLLLSIAIICTACTQSESGQTAQPSPEEEPGLTSFELEHGIGPITERIEIDDEINEALRIQGQEIYEMKCEMCHTMENRLVGPALGDVLDRRSPEYVMNMILNPMDMTNNHPVGQELLREYMTIMPFQNVAEDEARAIVEYLRDYNMNN